MKICYIFNLVLSNGRLIRGNIRYDTYIHTRVMKLTEGETDTNSEVGTQIQRGSLRL